MLVLSRQKDEAIMIGDDIEIIIVDVLGDKVRLGITHPKCLPVHRREIYDAIQREKDGKSETTEGKAETKADPELVFCCRGVYGANTPGQNAYIRVSQSDKKLDCTSLRTDGYCNFSNPQNSKKCPLGIEKFVG